MHANMKDGTGFSWIHRVDKNANAPTAPHRNIVVVVLDVELGNKIATMTRFKSGVFLKHFVKTKLKVASNNFFVLII